MIAVHAGALNANPTPRRKTVPRIKYGFARLIELAIARLAAARDSHRFMRQSSFFRLNMSASTPAGSVKRKNGRVAKVDMRERKSGDGVIVFKSQVAAML
jgi:hypothetical protein